MLKEALSILNKLILHKQIAYFAGGYVRDKILNLPYNDIDIVTSASVKEIEEIFPKTIGVGKCFGIVVVVEQGIPCEVATFRKEVGHTGRKPKKVLPATAKEDALRRDFTINGIFYSPIEDKIIDYVGGCKDIQNGIVRAIGNPVDRFEEDKLRIIRCIRYATRFDFKIEQKTLEAIQLVKSKISQNVSKERLWEEIKKADKYGNLYLFLNELYKTSVLTEIIPFDTNPVSITNVEAPTIYKLLQCCTNYKDWLPLCNYFKLSKKEISLVNNLHSFFLEGLDDYRWAQIYANGERTINYLKSVYKGTEFLNNHLKRIDKLKKHVKRMQDGKRIVPPTSIVAKGKELGNILKECERIAVNLNLDKQEDILKLVKPKKPKL